MDVKKYKSQNRAERAKCTLRSCFNTIPRCLDSQNVVVQSQATDVKEFFVFRRMVYILTSVPMKVVHLCKILPLFSVGNSSCSGTSGKALVNCRNCNLINDVIVLSIRFKYSVCSPIAYHKFAVLSDQRTQLVKYPQCQSIENVIMNFVYHIKVIWIKLLRLVMSVYGILLMNQEIIHLLKNKKI